MSADDVLLPTLRPLEVTAFRSSNNELYFSMHDLSQIAPQPMAISLPGYFVVAHLDGEHTCGQIRAAFAAEFGRAIEADQIVRVVEALDNALLLNTARFEQAYAARRDAYLAGDVRDNRQRWPDEAALRAELEAAFKAKPAATRSGTSKLDTTAPESLGDNPAGRASAPVRRAGTPAPPDCFKSSDGRQPGSDRREDTPALTALTGELAGLIAPHLDYGRGRPCYAEAYAALRAADLAAVRRFVLLGTNHFGRSASVVATGKDFVTPLGRVATDRALIEAVESRLGQSVRENEFDHVAEHSIELHVHLLQACRPDGDFTIVPVLCPDPAGPTGTRPINGCGPDLGAFADALRDVLAADGARTVLIASADLGHVGQRFGEPAPTDQRFMKRIGESDRGLLTLLEQRQDERFVDAIRATGNATRICSVGCLYTMLRALPGRSCRVARYHQAVDFDNEMHVTCAAGWIG